MVNIRAIPLTLFLLLPSHNAFQNLALTAKKPLRNVRRISTHLNVAAGIPVGSILNDDGMNEKRQENDRSYVMTDEPEHDWIRKLDYDSFGKEVSALGKELQKKSGEEDVDHLNKILIWRDIAAVVGLATMWAPLNPVSVVALSTWTYASWTMVAHHTCHGGYNRLDAGKYNSRGFAIGSFFKRISDWGDWMLPEAWNIEHNRLHHYHTSETLDPDVVENNMDFLREMKIPLALKYAIVGVLIPVWKWFYYAPNTYKELVLNRRRIEGKALPDGIIPHQAYTFKSMLLPENDAAKAMNEMMRIEGLFTTVLIPFLVSRFLLLPSPLLFVPGVGVNLFGHAVLNLIAAELLTNIHAFVTIVTNHAGNDLYKFDDEIKPKSGAFYVRQIVSSVNFDAGTDLVDFSHGWLNYQIEHHVWPDLSMLQYQRGAPKLKAICDKYNVPYLQENVWTRVRKTVDIMVGKSSMKIFPTKYEPKKDKATRGVTWRSTNGAIDDE